MNRTGPYRWNNFASVDMLATKFNRSKRRIQQILAVLKDEDMLEVVVGVYQDPLNPYAIPLYRRVDDET